MARKRIEKNLAYDDEKGLYYAYFDYGQNRNGNRVRRTKTFTEQKDAKLALLTFEVDKLRGSVMQPNMLTVSDWLSYWLEDVIRPNREYTTYYCYKCLVENHIVPDLGDISLQKLTPHRIQQYYTKMMQEKGLSPNSVSKHHILLHTAMKLAYRQGIIMENPVEKVEAPRVVPPKQVYYTPEQLKALFRATEGTWLEAVVKLGGYLGLRRGEMCGLRWKDVDMEREVIRIQVTRTTVGNETVVKKPKTASSVRTLGIHGLNDLIQVLEKLRQEQELCKAELGERYFDSGYVLTERDGLPRHPNQVSHALQKFVAENHLPPITVHGLRHTFASVANSAHIPMLDIGKALGHKDISITGRIYTHLFDQTHQETLNLVASRIQMV